jgi:ABC-type transport system involved in multi-copper enzyme maturation permease subunit
MALMAKDWRVVKPVVIIGFLFMLAPTVIQTSVNAWRTNAASDPTHAAVPYEIMREWFTIAVFIGFLLWCAICPAFGGIMFARERRDRSAELLELLPITRGVRLLSKVIITLVTLVATVVITTQFWHLGAWMWPSASTYAPSDLWEPMRPLIGLMIIMVGLSWLLSSIFRSEIIATAVTFGAVCLTAMLMGMLPGPANKQNWYEWINAWFPVPGLALAVLMATIGLLAFIAGCIITLRRREV